MRGGAAVERRCSADVYAVVRVGLARVDAYVHRGVEALECLRCRYHGAPVDFVAVDNAYSAGEVHLLLAAETNYHNVVEGLPALGHGHVQRACRRHFARGRLEAHIRELYALPRGGLYGEVAVDIGSHGAPVVEVLDAYAYERLAVGASCYRAFQRTRRRGCFGRGRVVLSAITDNYALSVDLAGHVLAGEDCADDFLYGYVGERYAHSSFHIHLVALYYD